MAKTLDYKNDLVRWEEIYEKLPYYDILENGELAIAKDEPTDESYLHHGHAMAIFPFSELDDRNPEDKRIMEATIFRLEVLGTGKWVGYSYPWMASIYTRARRGEAARYQLNLFADCFCTKNGFNLNGDFNLRGVSGFRYRPFTLEGNLAAADAIQEMLLQSHKDVIEVFPAIPDNWAKYGVSFKTLRAKGGFLISAKMENRKLTYLKIKSEGERTLRIEVKMENPTVKCSKNLKDKK